LFLFCFSSSCVQTGNIGYTRRRRTKQKQSRETDNSGYTRRRRTKQKPDRT
jgi:hypothetical protein